MWGATPRTTEEVQSLCLLSVCEPTVKASYSNSETVSELLFFSEVAVNAVTTCFWQYQDVCWTCHKNTKNRFMYVYVCVHIHTLLNTLSRRISCLKGVRSFRQSWDPGSGVKLCTERQMKCCLWAVQAKCFFHGLHIRSTICRFIQNVTEEVSCK